MLSTSLIIFVATFVVVCFSTRKIITIAKEKSLYDEPSNERKVHLNRIPNLGGIAIFLSTFLVSLCFIPINSVDSFQKIVVACGVIFLTGLADDLVGMSPGKKILAQLCVSIILLTASEFRLTDLHGLLGIHALPYTVSLILTSFFMLVIINAFNLIDGINGLAAGIGITTSAFFAFIFYQAGESGYFLLAVSLAAALCGFLVFNWTPARIFMGDTGSLFTGTMIAIFSTHVLHNVSQAHSLTSSISWLSPVMVPAVLLVPLYDTGRVFFLRIMNGKSPFFADRNHLHHKLLDLGLSHLQATGILTLTTVMSITLVFLLHRVNFNWQLASVAALATMLNLIVGLFGRKVSVAGKPLTVIHSVNPNSIQITNGAMRASGVLQETQ